MDIEQFKFETDPTVEKIYGENFHCPIEFDIEITIQRVLTILQYAINRLRVVAVLPLMVLDDKTYRPFFRDEDFDYILDNAIKYLPGLETLLLSISRKSTQELACMVDRISIFNEMKMGQSSERLMSSDVDYHITQVMHLVTMNKNLVNWIHKTRPKINEEAENFIHQIEQIRDITLDNMKIANKDHMQKEKDLKIALKTNLALTETLKVLEAQLEKQKKDIEADYTRKQKELEYLNERIDQTNRSFSDGIWKMVQRSEKQMMDYTIERDEARAETAERANQTVAEYNALLAANLKQESKLRAAKVKYETALASWITTYDTNIGDKNDDFERLEAEFNENDRIFNELTEQFLEQNETYVVLMEEKRIEDERLENVMVRNFLENMMARRLQRGWRGYQWRKAEKRRLKREKKLAKKLEKESGGKKQKSKTKIASATKVASAAKADSTLGMSSSKSSKMTSTVKVASATTTTSATDHS